MIRIGISGWRYPGWRGVFSPLKLPQRRELEYASRQFSTLELNGSLLPPPATLHQSRRPLRPQTQRPVRARTWPAVRHDYPLRHCVEIRHESFAVPDFIDLLRRHNIGFVVADTVEWPLLMDVTSDFVYFRLHGSAQLYASATNRKRSTYGPPASSLGLLEAKLQPVSLSPHPRLPTQHHARSLRVLRQ